MTGTMNDSSAKYDSPPPPEHESLSQSPERDPIPKVKHVSRVTAAELSGTTVPSEDGNCEIEVDREAMPERSVHVHVSESDAAGTGGGKIVSNGASSADIKLQMRPRVKKRLPEGMINGQKYLRAFL